MAATLTVTQTFSPTAAENGMVNRIELAWVSHTDGSVALATDVINGTILGFDIDPGATAPTALYDMTLTNTAGIDVLGGLGANLSATASSTGCGGRPFTDGTTTSIVPFVVAEALTLNITNAGSGKNGSLILYVR